MNITIRIILCVGLAAAIGCEPAEPAERGRPMVTTVERRAWETPVGAGEQLLTPHYRIFMRIRNEALRDYFPGFMEQAHRNYLDLTGLPANEGTDRLDMYVLATRDEWADLTTHHFGEEGSEVYLKLEAGGYMTDGVCVLWDIGPLPTLSVASHEGLHQFFHHRLENRIPMWAEEGLCSTAEGMTLYGNSVWFTPADNPSRFTSLRKVLVNSHWIPLAKLLPMDAGDAIGGHPLRVTGYYAQVWSLVLFIQSEDETREGFQRMLEDAQNGTLATAVLAGDQHPSVMQGRAYNQLISEPAFRHYISDDLADFDQRWRSWAMKLAKLSR